MATETGGDFVSKHFDRSVEARLIAIGTRRYYGVMLVTVAWIAAVISQWLFIMISENYSFASVQKYIPLVLCAIPFLPFTAHKVLFSKTFYIYDFIKSVHCILQISHIIHRIFNHAIKSSI